MIERPLYTEKIRQCIKTPFIKVITGVRRCGKSTLLLLTQQYLRDNGIREDQIVSINFESMKYYSLRDAHSLYTYVANMLASRTEMVYLFFDEIQIVDSWEEAVNSLMVDFQVNIFISGSNSHLLSSELSTLLTGRFIRIEIQVLSFREMLDFQRSTAEQEVSDELLWKFIRRGGFPAIHVGEYEEEVVYTILRDTYDSIVLRDVVHRYKIRDIDLLNRIMRFVIESIGHTISAKKIADYFKSQYRSVDISTIYTYLDALVSSYILRKVQRYDIQGKEILKTQEKYFLADQGMQHALFGYRDHHISGVLENIVYLELVRRGYAVYIGKLGKLEVDFVAERRDQLVYIQVAYKLENETTIEREFSPLLRIRDSYPKFVVTMDPDFTDTISGVRHVSLRRFLLDTSLF